MNTRTSLSIAGGGATERIELIAGEASFAATAAHGSKPFSVIAAGGTASTWNARFDLRLFGSGARVTCLADEVEVSYGGQSVRLRARERVAYGREGLGKTILVDPAVVSAWQRGMLIFDMTPLSEVIDELNRYRSGHIVLLNAELRRAPVNGRFRIDRPDEALLQIERGFGVKRRVLPGGFIVLS